VASKTIKNLLPRPVILSAGRRNTHRSFRICRRETHNFRRQYHYFPDR
jgi:hypothetical protein